MSYRPRYSPYTHAHIAFTIGNPVVMQVIVESEEANFEFVASDFQPSDRIKKKFRMGMSIGEMQAEAYMQLVPPLIAQLYESGIGFNPPSDIQWKGRTQAILCLN